MGFLRSYWCPACLGLVTIAALLCSSHGSRAFPAAGLPPRPAYRENEVWWPPADEEIPADTSGDLIRYGKELVCHTADYLGPKGLVASISNGMNCQNCHIDGGTHNFANPFSGVSGNYPKYRDRSGRVESVEFRVNECLQRSLNGSPLDSLSPQMRAIVAYVRWVGKNVPAGIRPKGMGAGTLSLMERAADPQKGRLVYIRACQRCHGANGEGTRIADAPHYLYPPLWGPHSFNTSAGMLRLSQLAAFIRNNMPLDATAQGPALSEEEAWDVAAWISAQERPAKFFRYDWRDISRKPFDYPFGPYVDSFSEKQHRYGPFRQMKARR